MCGFSLFSAIYFLLPSSLVDSRRISFNLAVIHLFSQFFWKLNLGQTTFPSCNCFYNFSTSSIFTSLQPMDHWIHYLSQSCYYSFVSSYSALWLWMLYQILNGLKLQLFFSLVSHAISPASSWYSLHYLLLNIELWTIAWFFRIGMDVGSTFLRLFFNLSIDYVFYTSEKACDRVSGQLIWRTLKKKVHP